MKPLFSPEGEAALASAMRAGPLLAFDFDGTLAPIVPRPDDARVPPGLAECLGRLAQWRPVAVVTGRAIDDVTPRLGFTPHYVVGSHGAEDPGRMPDAHAAMVLDRFRDILLPQLAVLGDAGVSFEDKGMSIALHYRLADDPDLAMAAIDRALHGLDPALHRFGGKYVVNVTALSSPDKGDAVVSLKQRSRSGSVIFLGDDLNDEAVFERAQPNWLTVRIGRDYAASRAAWVLDSHADVVRLADTMVGMLSAGGVQG